MRKLASVRIVKDIKPIEGADNIEVVTIDGWNCISRKGEFTVGELCVYFEIDSFLPIKPEFEFLRKSSYRKMGEQEGFKLRTIKLRGTLSQGLALPLNSINDLPEDIKEGDDLTEYLGVILFEKPIPHSLMGKASNFPSFLRKTDQERIQNIWDKVKDSNDLFEVTLKMDGTSCTYYLNEGVFGVCSRNLEIADTPGNTLWEIARRYDIEGMLRAYDENIALQGEVVGEGIQKNPHGIKGQDFYLFDIWSIDEEFYYSPIGRVDRMEEYFSLLKHVPILLDSSHLKDIYFDRDINKILDFAGTKEFKEGVVFKSHYSDLTFKVISNNYLLNEE